MRLIYFDIDTLRPDHLGCYGYPRPTSPVIDDLARRGVRFDNVHASDTPCLPSRTALSTGRFGIRTGVVNHGGTSTDPFPEGDRRGMRTLAAATSWMAPLRALGMWTASISTFAERHSAYHFEAGFNECVNLGSGGMETADEVAAVAEEWLARNAWRPDWFLHVHLWDPHTPYRTPAAFGDPFAGDPVPEWLTEEVRAAHWDLPGPHSPQEVAGFGPRDVWDRWPRQPLQVADQGDVRRMFDGYDTGVRFADQQVGRVLETLADLGLDEDTAVLVSSDHGENLGELGIYCDHQTADQCTTRLPAVLWWPGLQLAGDGSQGADAGAGGGVGGGSAGRADDGMHYQVDLWATVLELAGAEVPAGWDGVSFAADLVAGRPSGRDHLVLSHGAWTVQRSVRFGPWLCIRTYHDAFHGFPDVLLFDVVADPHEQHDLAGARPDVVEEALALLAGWGAEALARSDAEADPLWEVLAGTGPWHSRVDVDWYLDRLRATGRGGWADRFAARDRTRVVGPGPSFLAP